MVRPTIALFANPDTVGVSLVETFISGLNNVKILSTKIKSWEKALSHVAQKGSLKIINPEKKVEYEKFNYLILVNLDLNFKSNEIMSVARMAAAQNARILIILPYVTEGVKAWQQREKIREIILGRIPEAGIIYAGELLGPKYLGRETNYITRNITGALEEGEVEQPEKTTLFPVSISDFSRYLARNLFSFGPYGKEIAVYSQEVSSEEFESLIGGYFERLYFKPSKLAGERQKVLGIGRITLKTDFARNLRDTILWAKGRVLNKSTKIKKRGNVYFLSKGAIIGTIALLLTPFLLGVATFILVYLSIFFFKNGNLSWVKKILPIATTTSGSAQKFFSAYSQIPVLSGIYKPFALPSKILYRGLDLGGDGLILSDKIKTLTGFVLGEEVYDPSTLSQEIVFLLDDLYQNTSFLESEISSLGDRPKKLTEKYIKGGFLDGSRQKILGSRKLFENLPEILGKGAPKTYLVLLQNNMELRPTGGFIGSFALVNFDSGRLVDISVSDVYAADGQLKGHVEPPSPIKKYLGEANWFLRDSNWDPDFPTAAERAQWFLDKEIDRRVDGVIAVDLEVAIGILRATGPVILPDFNKVFDYKNLYESLQSEVESDFFPGSQKKTSILTALTKELMNRLSSLEEDDYIPVARETLENFESRHIQVYFNQKIWQEAISQMGYSGGLIPTQCLQDCFGDWYASVDANVGVSKANYFIQREFNLTVDLTDGFAKKALEIKYTNTANPALGLSGRYRTYTRTFVPESSVFEKIQIENSGSVVETEPEVESFNGGKSGGVNLEISPGQTKKLTFRWQTPYPENLTTAEYNLFVRKQAGTGSDPLNINVLTPVDIKSYNTLLDRDFFTRISY